MDDALRVGGVEGVGQLGTQLQDLIDRKGLVSDVSAPKCFR